MKAQYALKCLLCLTIGTFGSFAYAQEVEEIEKNPSSSEKIVMPKYEVLHGEVIASIYRLQLPGGLKVILNLYDDGTIIWLDQSEVFDQAGTYIRNDDYTALFGPYMIDQVPKEEVDILLASFEENNVFSDTGKLYFELPSDAVFIKIKGQVDSISMQTVSTQKEKERLESAASEKGLTVEELLPLKTGNPELRYASVWNYAETQLMGLIPEDKSTSVNLGYIEWTFGN